MYDIFLITNNPSDQYQKLKNRFPRIKAVGSIAEARRKSFTKYYWVVWDDMLVLDNFNFDYTVEPWDQDLVHCCRNSNESLGVALIPKKLEITDERAIFNNEVRVINQRSSFVKNDPLDIVFISNGESTAEEHWSLLQEVTDHIPNRVVRVDGVTGRSAAYKTAAQASNTEHFFAVFAKIKIYPDFDFSWTPAKYEDRHYVFMAENPVNGLVYGHQAVIAYCKKLVLVNPGDEIDFTLAQPYEEVNRLSGTAVFNTSPQHAWRTAFREALKLKLYSERGEQEASYRLERWLAPSHALYGDWSQKGAHDALLYFTSVGGDYTKLLASYEWKWLDQFFSEKYASTLLTT